MINWEVIIWTCITISILTGIVGLILTFISLKSIRKRKMELEKFILI